MSTLDHKELSSFFWRHAPVLWPDRWTCRCGQWALSRKLNSVEQADESRSQHVADAFLEWQRAEASQRSETGTRPLTCHSCGQDVTGEGYRPHRYVICHKPGCADKHVINSELLDKAICAEGQGMTNIEDLRSRIRMLLPLLEGPQPGLSTWRENYEHAASNVLAFFGYGQTAGVLTRDLGQAGSDTPAPRDARDTERDAFVKWWMKIIKERYRFEANVDMMEAAWQAWKHRAAQTTPPPSEERE